MSMHISFNSLSSIVYLEYNSQGKNIITVFCHFNVHPYWRTSYLAKPRIMAFPWRERAAGSSTYEYRGRRGWAWQAEPRPPLSSPVERRIEEASAPPPPSRLLSYIGHTTPRSWSEVAEARHRLRRSEESSSGRLVPPRQDQAQPPRHQLHPISLAFQVSFRSA